MKFISKINDIFGIKRVKEAKGAEVWMVYWYTVQRSTFNDYWSKGRQVSKGFLLEEDAKAFADSLKKANELLQNNNDICCEVVKQK